MKVKEKLVDIIYYSIFLVPIIISILLSTYALRVFIFGGDLPLILLLFSIVYIFFCIYLFATSGEFLEQCGKVSVGHIMIYLLYFIPVTLINMELIDL